MIAVTIFLCVLTGLLLVWLCGLHKQINIFEQLALGFSSALSIFLLELFLMGLTGRLSLIGAGVTFVIVLGAFIYKSVKHNYHKHVYASLQSNCRQIAEQCRALNLWKKIAVGAMLIYVFIKITMTFLMNTHMPTFDEDAVGGWDLKAKIFTENKSLVLDKSSPEFLGSALERNIFAPLTDTYFLLGESGDVTGYTNIISPLFYLIAILALFGIFLRRTNIFFAALSSYIFVSLPFVFIHGFTSYWNLPSGVLLFIWIFYLMEQFLLPHTLGNKNILYVILPMTFLTTTVRNESLILAIILMVGSVATYWIINRKDKIHSSVKKAGFGVLLSLAVCYALNKSVTLLYPKGAALWVGVGSNDDMIGTFFKSLTSSETLIAPINNAFYHSDYNIIFLLILLSLIFFIWNKRREQHMTYMFVYFFLLLFGTIAILFSNLSLGILTHFSFVRFGLVFVLFAVYIVTYSVYEFFSQNHSFNN